MPSVLHILHKISFCRIQHYFTYLHLGPIGRSFSGQCSLNAALHAAIMHKPPTYVKNLPRSYRVVSDALVSMMLCGAEALAL